MSDISIWILFLMIPLLDKLRKTILFLIWNCVRCIVSWGFYSNYWHHNLSAFIYLNIKYIIKINEHYSTTEMMYVHSLIPGTCLLSRTYKWIKRMINSSEVKTRFSNSSIINKKVFLQLLQIIIWVIFIMHLSSPTVYLLKWRINSLSSLSYDLYTPAYISFTY